MCSIRNATLYAAASLVALPFAGCQWMLPPPSMQINPAPVVVDDAMQRRDFEPTTAYYVSGVTVAGPTGLYVRSDPRLPNLARGAVETPLFVGQVIAMPFTMIFVDRPWEDVAYPRAQAPSSYTAAPPTGNTY